MLVRLLFVALAVAGTALVPPSLTVTHDARALQPGELVVLTIASDAALPSVTVTAFGRTERVQSLPPTATQPHRWIALVGIDLDVRPGPPRVTVSAGRGATAASTTHTLNVIDKTFSTRRLTVDPNFVNPPASENARIQREAVALSALWKGGAGPDPVTDLMFVAPVPHAANSVFGQRSIFNGEPRSAHGGADFLSPAGTPIKAPAPGKVMLADDLYYTGGTVVVDHGLGIVSLFAHLSKVTAAVGDDVERGATVGLVGATGRVTGAHLHWTVRVNGARVDPLSLVAVLSSNASGSK
jgi:murein DD-endopeptidase MepM/ murein hydrolase activator NlpD